VQNNFSMELQQRHFYRVLKQDVIQSSLHSSSFTYDIIDNHASSRFNSKTTNSITDTGNSIYYSNTTKYILDHILYRAYDTMFCLVQHHGNVRGTPCKSLFHFLSGWSTWSPINVNRNAFVAAGERVVEIEAVKPIAIRIHLDASVCMTGVTRFVLYLLYSYNFYYWYWFCYTL
jgi:hypothetical protein